MESQGYNCDTFVVSMPASSPTTLDRYVKLFFKTPVFRIERFVLKHAAGVTITDKDVEQCTLEVGSSVGIWQIIEREPCEALAVWTHGQAVGCTWWRLEHQRDGSPVLMFGSGIKAPDNLNLAMRLLLQLATQGHYVYSRVLLWNAARDLGKATKT
eukprot:TRINITY_DN12599_c1_g1_i1.p1 TRINITY_DN12599_c1_g1~~TRINITY_DN12599_c1_g1_i1.p1  ORF type:complete len:156 (+),score=22.25 TRINITY_DN12599_c1_g1_i1:207-674(+)